MTRQRTIEFSPVVAEQLPLLREATSWWATCRSARAGPSAARSPTPIRRRSTRRCCRRWKAKWSCAGPQGRRIIAAAELFQTILTTRIAADEILVEVRLPAMPAGAGYALEEFARRHGDFAIVGIAAMIVCARASAAQAARLATAGAGPRAVRLRAAEQILERDGLGDGRHRGGRRRGRRARRAAADIHASADYRRHLTRRADRARPAPGGRR